MRTRIVAVAREWCGTPYHHWAAVKHVGADCVGFVAAVYRESGALPDVTLPAYSPQWFLHQRRELLIEHVVANGGREIAGPAAPGPGDLVLYRLGFCFAHAAIVVDWPRQIIHAHMASGRVLATPAGEGDMAGRATKFFTLFATGTL